MKTVSFLVGGGLTTGSEIVALVRVAAGWPPWRFRMDATTEKCPQDKSAAYTTSKQVQAWFLGRSRDLWKKKYAELKVESKRLHQRVADVCKSRDNWRSEVETTQRELRELHVQNAELQARLDAIGEDASQKNARSSHPR
jgi:chromosome segregation ATPase